MKTPKDFDYDLWITEDGKCMVRIKSTGEVTEVDRDVMRVLRAEEKKLRRSFVHTDLDETEEPILSLDAICDSSEVDEAAWLIDGSQNVESEITWKELKDDFSKILTPAELSVFTECLLNEKRKTVYANEHGVTKQTVQTLINRIKEKAKKFF